MQTDETIATQVSFAFVIENITGASVDELLDDLLDFIASHGYPEVPIAIPGDVTKKIGGSHEQA